MNLVYYGQRGENNTYRSTNIYNDKLLIRHLLVPKIESLEESGSHKTIRRTARERLDRKLSSHGGIRECTIILCEVKWTREIQLGHGESEALDGFASKCQNRRIENRGIFPRQESRSSYGMGTHH